MDREIVMKVVLNAEWSQFQKVENEGGRAPCQDDRATFEIMRRSQFMPWPREALESYMEDLRAADESGWNLVLEKYIRMMESTAPERYRSLRALLPERSPERLKQTEETVREMAGQAEEFAKTFPALAGRGRALRSRDDGPWDTSFETYLRGELLTYSDRTFRLYRDMADSFRRQGISLFRLVMENQVRFYGFKDLEEAEWRYREGR